MRTLRIVAIVLTMFGTACGYTLAGRGSTLPVNIKTIGIPLFTNRTTVFNLETKLTDKVRSEFIGRAKYSILPEANNVDALLTGEVTAVRRAGGAGVIEPLSR